MVSVVACGLVDAISTFIPLDNIAVSSSNIKRSVDIEEYWYKCTL